MDAERNDGLVESGQAAGSSVDGGLEKRAVDNDGNVGVKRKGKGKARA